VAPLKELGVGAFGPASGRLRERGGGRRRDVEAYPIASAGLRLVERIVGPTKQILGLIDFLARKMRRDAHADGDDAVFATPMG
jgi:hypothetical protein